LEVDELRVCEGTLEWDESYSSFRGTIHEELSFSGRRSVSDMAVAFVQTPSLVVARVEHVGEDQRAPVTFYRIPPDRLEETGLLRVLPDRKVFFQSITLNANLDPRPFLRDAAIDLGQNPFERKVEAHESIVLVKCVSSLRGGSEMEMEFDLEAGGLCRRQAYEVKRGTSFEHCEDTRKWTKSADGRWYPELSEGSSWIGKRSGTPRCVHTLKIDSFEPLVTRTYQGPPEIDMFGEMPARWAVIEVQPDGTIGSRNQGRQPSIDRESALKEAAQKARDGGFADPTDGAD
jgi:hypothetical protein